MFHSACEDNERDIELSKLSEAHKELIYSIDVEVNVQVFI